MHIQLLQMQKKMMMKKKLWPAIACGRASTNQPDGIHLCQTKFRQCTQCCYCDAYAVQIAVRLVGWLKHCHLSINMFCVYKVSSRYITQRLLSSLGPLEFAWAAGGWQLVKLPFGNAEAAHGNW